MTTAASSAFSTLVNLSSLHLNCSECSTQFNPKSLSVNRSSLDKQLTESEQEHDSIVGICWECAVCGLLQTTVVISFKLLHKPKEASQIPDLSSTGLTQLVQNTLEMLPDTYFTGHTGEKDQNQESESKAQKVEICGERYVIPDIGGDIGYTCLKPKNHEGPHYWSNNLAMG